LVICANEVINPAARLPGNPDSGMPILDVDHAHSVIVIKRSMGPRVGRDRQRTVTGPRTGMYFTDAKKGLAALTSAVKTHRSANPARIRQLAYFRKLAHVVRCPVAIVVPTLRCPYRA